MYPLPTLTQMPWHIKERVVNFTDPVSRLSLRNCSRELRNIVDRSCVSFKSISLVPSNEVICVEVITKDGQQLTIDYHREPQGCVVFTCLDGKSKSNKFIEGADFVETAVSGLADILKSRKASVGDFQVELSDDRKDNDSREAEPCELALLRSLDGVLRKFNHKLAVDKFRCSVPLNQAQALQLLSHFKPGADFKITLTNDVKNIDLLVDSEHWMQAKRLKMVSKRNCYPIDKMTHFRYLCLEYKELPVTEIDKVLEIALKHGDNFELALLEFEENEQLAEDIFQHFRQFAQDGTANDFVLPIPGSRNWITVDVLNQSVEISIASPDGTQIDPICDLF